MGESENMGHPEDVVRGVGVEGERGVTVLMTSFQPLKTDIHML